MTDKQRCRNHSLALNQIAHFLKTGCRPNVPQWYETQRKTTRVVFWS